jgi:hypothetical protein
MCFNARLGEEALEEIERLEHRALVLLTMFPVFSKSGTRGPTPPPQAAKKFRFLPQ